MATVTDFKGWLDSEGLDTAEDMLQVYRPVKDGEPGWTYEIEPITTGAPGRFLLKGGADDLLLTVASREAFRKYMDSLYELGIEGQAMFEHAMARDD